MNNNAAATTTSTPPTITEIPFAVPVFGNSGRFGSSVVGTAGVSVVEPSVVVPSVVVEAVVAKMAFPYHRLHHYAAVVLRAVGVQHIGVGLIVLLHVFVV